MDIILKKIWMDCMKEGILCKEGMQNTTHSFVDTEMTADREDEKIRCADPVYWDRVRKMMLMVHIISSLLLFYHNWVRSRG